jgi:osmotically-inducible protein OsmY
MMVENVMLRTDEDIKRDLVDEMYWDYKVDASDIKIEVSDGRVTLTGTVPSYSARNAASTATWGIDGVTEVINLLTVEFPPALTVPADTDLKTRVENSLTWNPDIYSVDIDVRVTDGVVRLEGTVDSYWKRWKAEDIISDLSGVIDVENHLAVVPSESFVDKDIAEDIESALERNIYVDAEQVTVKVENGKVTLTGTVPSYFARGKAYDAAAFTPGVIEVDNNLVVT